MKAFWIVSLIVFFIGAVASGYEAWLDLELYGLGKAHFDKHVKRAVDKGYPHEDAVNYVNCKNKHALIQAVAEAVIGFVCIYVFVDILLTYVIGG